MSVTRLILRELLYRKLNTLLMLLSVTVAVGCLVAALAMLRQHDRRTEQLVAAREAETKKRMEVLEDDYRKITKNMGFNVLILPKEQSLGNLYAENIPTQTMPEEYAQKLAQSRVATINHVLPSLHEKLQWPEQERIIYLIGVRGEAYIQNPQQQKPILQAVPPGTVVVGHELHRNLKLAVGQKVTLLGREFAVHKLHPQRGTRDDITVWIDLRQAQEMLGKTGQINAILALECGCEADRLDQIRAEIGRILPDTQVIEFASQALARAETRNRAAQESKAAIEQEKESRAELRGERELLAAILVPIVLVGCGAWIGLLTYSNVSDRKGEIGILRALGVRTRQVLVLFLGKALVLGFMGAWLGYAAGVLLGASWAGDAGQTHLSELYFDPRTLVLSLISAPLLAGLASWLPALLATRQHPAVILREV